MLNLRTMEPFEVHILGCGSALPTTRHNASSQVVKIGNKLFMIDCGEGTQLQLRRGHIHFSFINHIFITHLHGDHSFGLIGLISTFGLLGRTAPLHIYADPMLEKIMRPQLDFYCKDIKYPLFFHSIDAGKQDIIFEDNTVTVETIPLSHRMPCCGFLFKEKPKKRHLLGDAANYYNIPAYLRTAIKEGADFTTTEGKTIPNNQLTREPDPSRSYAYCSDTKPCPAICKQIEGADLLYHEATFAESEKGRARQTFHSTAREAAEIAMRANVKRLIIGHYSSRYEDESVLLSEAMEVFPNSCCSDEGMVFNV